MLEKDVLTSVLSANTAGFASFIYFHDLPYLHNNQMTMLQTYKLSHVRVLGMGTWQRVLHSLFTPSGLNQSFHFFRRSRISLAFWQSSGSSRDFFGSVSFFSKSSVNKPSEADNGRSRQRPHEPKRAPINSLRYLVGPYVGLKFKRKYPVKLGFQASDRVWVGNTVI